MTLAAVMYYEAHPRHRHRTAFLFGGVFVAIMIGVMEGSGTDTIILTNMPWCIALGILMDVLIHSLVVAKPFSSQQLQDASLREGQYRETEKAIQA
jgi:hypothetical protein